MAARAGSALLFPHYKTLSLNLALNKIVRFYSVGIAECERKTFKLNMSPFIVAKLTFT